jgi:hypothetical protein
MESQQSEANDQTQRTVHCERHGDNREAFMCKHLLLGSGLGFFSDIEEPENPYPDAWCSECELVRGENGESAMFESEYALANFKLVCGECYKEIKTKHVVIT